MFRFHLFFSHRGPEAIDICLELFVVRVKFLVFAFELRDPRTKGEYSQAGLDDGFLVILASMPGDVHVRRAIREELCLPVKVGRVEYALVDRG